MRKPFFLLALLSLSAGTLSGAGLAPQFELERKTAAIAPYKNWGLFNTNSKSHIDALNAWKIEEGSKKVTVAVIDTGIDYTHKSLKPNIWKNPGSQPDKPIYGWNFVTNQPNPVDEHGHGTHVAGIIGAVEDLKSGISGVVRNVSIMAVKYYSEGNSGDVNLANTIKAINYAIDQGAKIINYSGGGPQYSKEEEEAIKKAEAKGILFVAAAGNERQNTDEEKNYYYPSAYQLSNVISVAAIDINGNLLKSSNWGKNKVDVVAPGENILSTLPGGRYGYMSGTSQATAFVTGVAALLLSHDPTLKPEEIKEIIRKTTDPIEKLKDKIASGGKVNAYSALLALKNRKQPIHPEPGFLAERPTALLDSMQLPPIMSVQSTESQLQ